MSTGRTGRHLRHRAPPSGRLNPARRSRPSPKPIDFGVLPKCSSEPLLFPAIEDAGDFRSSDSSNDGLIFRLSTWNDLFVCPSEASDASPLSRPTNAGYERDSKVVITVTVEGSPGPIRALVKLGATVEDAIKLVIRKYEEEGRTPRLDQRASSSFDLHLSYFSLQCLDRRNAIGEVGSRSFYLRKCRVKSHEEVITSQSNPDLPRISPKQSSSPSSMGVVPWLMNQKISKFVRRMRKLFKLFGCLHSR